MLCFKKFLVAKKSMEKSGEGGLSKLSVENFLSHSTEIFRRGTLLCCVSENFRWRKKLWKGRGDGENRIFPSIIFCPEVLKPFVEETLSLSLVSGIENIYAS